MSTPTLRDASGELLFTEATDRVEQALIAAGATQIVRNRHSRRVGVYVDCETGSAAVGSVAQRSERDAVAEQMVARHVGQVIVSLFPDETTHRVPGCVCCPCWYPFHLGGGWRPPKDADGYVLQWLYAHPGDTPPTRLQRGRLLTWTRLRHPHALILLY